MARSAVRCMLLLGGMRCGMNERTNAVTIGSIRSRRSGANPCYPPPAMTRHASYRSQPLAIADFVRTNIPTPIRIATSGITTADAPKTLIASERNQM